MAHVPGHPAGAARRAAASATAARVRPVHDAARAGAAGRRRRPRALARAGSAHVRPRRAASSRPSWPTTSCCWRRASWRASRSSPQPRATPPSGSARRSSSPPAAGPGEPSPLSGVSPRAPCSVLGPSAVGRISMRSAIDCFSASTCDTTPTTRPPGAQPAELGEHRVERVRVERAEALVDEQRAQVDPAGLGGDDVRHAEREAQRHVERLAAGQGARVARAAR